MSHSFKEHSRGPVADDWWRGALRDHPKLMTNLRGGSGDPITFVGRFLELNSHHANGTMNLSNGAHI